MKKFKLLTAIAFALFSLLALCALTACSHTHKFTQEIQDPEYLASEYDCMKNVQYYKSCTCGESSQGRPEQATFTGTPAAHRTLQEVQDDKFLVVKASCTEKGVYYKSCVDCGEASTEVFTIDMLPHTYEPYAIVDSTTEYCEGHDYIMLCSVCRDQKLDAQSFWFESAHCDDWHVVKAPTTTEEGRLEGLCSECNRTAAVTLKKLVKNSSFYQVEVFDACDEEGLIRYTYTIDDQEFVFEDKTCPIRHLIGSKDIYDYEFDVKSKILFFDTYSDGITLFNGKDKPTCSVKGEDAFFHCSRCEKNFSVKTRTEHETPEEYTVTEASCDKLYITFNCEGCNDPNAVKVIDGIGHNYEYVLSPERAGNYNSFKLEYICLNELEDTTNGKFICSHVDRAKSVYGIKKSELKITPATCYEGTIYEYTYNGVVYSYNDETPETSHLYVKDGKNYRLESGHTYYIDACPGIEVLGNQDDIPACDERGRSAVFNCAECGFHYEIRVILEKHQKPDDYVTPEADCDTIVESHYHCKGCNKDQVEYVSAVGHVYTYEIKLAPTRTTTGKAVLTCSRCNEVTEIVMPKLPKSDNSDYTVKVNQHESCEVIGRYVYTYHYTYTIEKYGKANETGKVDMTFNHIEGLVEHTNSCDDGSLQEIVIEGLRYKGYICSKCGRFIIVEQVS